MTVHQYKNLKGYKKFENFEEFLGLIRNKELQFNITNKRNIRDNHRLILRNNSEMRAFTEYLRREQNNFVHFQCTGTKNCSVIKESYKCHEFQVVLGFLSVCRRFQVMNIEMNLLSIKYNR